MKNMKAVQTVPPASKIQPNRFQLPAIVRRCKMAAHLIIWIVEDSLKQCKALTPFHNGHPPSCGVREHNHPNYVSAYSNADKFVLLARPFNVEADASTGQSR